MMRQMLFEIGFMAGLWGRLWGFGQESGDLGPSSYRPKKACSSPVNLDGYMMRLISVHEGFGRICHGSKRISWCHAVLTRALATPNRLFC